VLLNDEDMAFIKNLHQFKNVVYRGYLYLGLNRYRVVTDGQKSSVQLVVCGVPIVHVV